MSKREKSLTYEEAVQRLEAMIERIESGEAGLEQSLAHYEEGMKLIAHCRGILAGAEQKIAALTLTSRGIGGVAGDEAGGSTGGASGGAGGNPGADTDAETQNPDEVDGHLDDDDQESPF